MLKTFTTSAVMLLATAATAQRVAIDFGHGWRYHVGDDPAGPGIGAFDIASGFKNVSSCTGMVEKQLYHPGGHKNAGQRYTGCAVACSYDLGCTAYHDQRLASGQHCANGTCCWHGTAATKCTTKAGVAVAADHPAAAIGPARLKTASGFFRGYHYAEVGFDASSWRSTSLPHDPLINGTFAAINGEGSAFLPRPVVWYRKRFAVPVEWRGKHIFVYFQGAFQFAEVYLNGESIQDHETGYTTWTVRLDNSSSLKYGAGEANANTLAIRVDPSFCSGHWYEGGGINRPLQIVATPKLHFVQGGVFPNPNSDGTTLRVSTEIDDLAAGPEMRTAGATVGVGLTLRDAATGVVAATATQRALVGGVSSVTMDTKLQVWSPQTPTTYTLTAKILPDGDEVNVTSVGVRVFDWNRKKARLNGHEIELQGFSHHPSFAGMGSMTSPRQSLFLAQVTKALGVNFWRNSHNPYEDAVYEMLSECGIMNWDENRNFGSEQANQYHDMIKSHRHVVATMLYGLCNEGQCGVEQGAAAAAFLKVKNALDPERPQTANSVGNQDYNFPHLDIIGESGSSSLNMWHAKYGIGGNKTNNLSKPCTVGEHGFGNNHLYDSRGPLDRSLARLGANISSTFSGMLDAEGKGWGNLKPKQTEPVLLSSHGLGMWAMMDYYGEAYEGWPTFVKSRGHLDLAGFPRPTAWWYRSNYLARADVPLYQKPLHKSYPPQVRVMSRCQFLASTPKLQIVLDGHPHGAPIEVSEFGLVDTRSGSNKWPPAAGPTPCSIKRVGGEYPERCILDKTYGCFDGLKGMWVSGGCRGDFVVDGLARPIECACIGSQGFCETRTNCSADALHCGPPFSTARNVTAVGIAVDGSMLGIHSLLTGADTTKATKLELSIDVPSVLTGTGSALYLDGQDVAFVRAQLLDSAGVLARGSDVNLTYSVVSGPVRLVGTGSGSIRNHQHVNGDTYQTWQGLGRAVFQATLDCTGEHRAVAAQIDLDAPTQSPRTYATSCVTAADMVAVVRAVSADGALSATATIKLSGDKQDSPLEVARANRELTFDYFTAFPDSLDPLKTNLS